jgi:RND family efflux transporter MFP subunit
VIVLKIKNSKYPKLLIAGLCLALVFSCKKEEKQAVKLPKPVIAIQIGNISNLSERSFPGKAEASQEVTLSFRVSGQVIEKLVKPGDKVVKGQILAKLDPTDFQSAQTVAQGQLSQAEATFTNAAADYNRAIKAKEDDSGSLSQQYVDKTKAIMLAAQAAKISAEASEKIARDRLSYTILKAPFSGEVSGAYIESFETVIAKQAICRVLNRDYLEFQIDIPENLINYSQYIKGAHIIFDTQKDLKVTARVSEIGREASSVTRTYPVKLIVQQPKGFDILPGMAGKAYVKAFLPDSSPNTGTEIPSTALFTNNEQNKSFVWLIEDDKLKKQEVKISLLGDYGVLVNEGLNEGDWLVTKGVTYLNEGQSVSIIDDSKQ